LIAGFNSPGMTSDGSGVIFRVGALKGTEATGVGDVYEAKRTAAGWATSLIGPTAKQAGIIENKGTSADHSVAFWLAALNETPQATYVRYPDGSFRLLGEGSLASDPSATGRWISPGGQHVVFTSTLQLEPKAPETLGFIPFFNFLGFTVNEVVDAVYERTPTGVEVVSLLPGDETPPEGSSTFYRGTSYDGSSVVFNVDGTMYVRHDGITKEVVTSFEPQEITYEGTSRDGTKVFYLHGGSEGSYGGELFVYDYVTGETTQVGSALDTRVVNISTDGSTVYFESTEQIDGEGSAGEANVYAWKGGDVKFVGTLDPADLDLSSSLASGSYGLIHWAGGIGIPEQANSQGLGGDPSRTADGSVFIFESHANLTMYDSDGHVEIYRYVVATGSLTCVSCNGSGAPAVSDAVLQGNGPASPAAELVEVHNLSEDGKTVFFMSGDALVPEDSDGVQDVYEWKEGTVSLISSGRSTGGKNWLYAASDDGEDVIFQSTDILVSEKHDETPAFYDAKVNGGFVPVVTPVPSGEESCQGSATPPRGEASIGSRDFVGPTNRKVHKPGCKKKQKKHCKRRHSHKSVHQGKKRHQQPTGRAGR
jgi:hypothetical protein